VRPQTGVSRLDSQDILTSRVKIVGIRTNSGKSISPSKFLSLVAGTESGISMPLARPHSCGIVAPRCLYHRQLFCCATVIRFEGDRRVEHTVRVDASLPVMNCATDDHVA